MTSDPIAERQEVAAEYCAKVDQQAHLQSGMRFLAAIGIGLAAGVAFYALRPTPNSRQRLGRLVADMEKRLLHMSKPALRKAGDMASQGSGALVDGMHDGEARVEHFLRDAGRRVRAIWS